MTSTSADQRFALLTALGANVDWDQLSTEEVQVGIREAKRAGREFTAFVKNGFCVLRGDDFRTTHELSIHIPALPAMSLQEIQAWSNERFSWVKSIERDSAPTEAVTLTLVTVLREGEDRIPGKEYERRIAPHQDLILGIQQAIWLEEHQDEFPEFMALLGKIYIDFSGMVVVDGGGSRHVFCLGQGGGRWYVGYGWLGRGFGRLGRVASSRK